MTRMEQESTPEGFPTGSARGLRVTNAAQVSQRHQPGCVVERRQQRLAAALDPGVCREGRLHVDPDDELRFDPSLASILISTRERTRQRESNGTSPSVRSMARPRRAPMACRLR